MLTVSFSDGTVVDIEDEVLATLCSYEQRLAWSQEAGGILVGKKLLGEEHYVLSAASTPTKRDRRTRFSFTRSKQSAQTFIDKHWKVSGGVENYIGEWHTHPERNPHPSGPDKALIKQVIADRSSPFPKVILIIVGQNATFYIGLAKVQGTGDISTYKHIEVKYEHIRSKK